MNTMFTEPLNAVTPEQMRASIEALRRDHPLVHGCMKFADIEQMTPVDRYTMLAFAALQALARSEQARLVSAWNAPPNAGGYQPIGTTGPVQPPPRKP